MSSLNKPFNLHDQRSLLIALENVMEYIKKVPVQKPCDICISYEAGGHCKKWDAEIPVEARPEGCDSFEFNPQSPPF